MIHRPHPDNERAILTWMLAGTHALILVILVVLLMGSR